MKWAEKWLLRPARTIARRVENAVLVGKIEAQPGEVKPKRTAQCALLMPLARIVLGHPRARRLRIGTRRPSITQRISVQIVCGLHARGASWRAAVAVEGTCGDCAMKAWKLLPAHSHRSDQHAEFARCTSAVYGANSPQASASIPTRS